MKKKIQKPFDAEAAKRGARVETKDGQPVRILCYDRVDINYSIVALINRQNIELCATYNSKGQMHYDRITDSDLVIVEEVEVSKFNPGDWVFRKDDGNRPWLITAITSDCYEMHDIQGQQKALVYQTTVDVVYRLWTLKDAKPGNILVSTDDNRPFIFKGLFYDGAPTAYCGIDTRDSITVSASGNAWTHKPVRPATYEERLQLFNKLEEKGYKWDTRTFTLWKKM